MRLLSLPLRVVLCLAALAFTPMLAGAALQATPGLTSITFHEVSGVTTPYSFGVSSPQMLAQLPGLLGSANQDFNGLSDEHYDVFYSDAAGVADPNGDYITVECRFERTGGGGGCNIAEVELNFQDGSTVCGCAVTSFVQLGANASPGSEVNAADCNLATLTTMGNSSGTTQRMRLTIDFSCDPTAARSATWGATKIRYR